MDELLSEILGGFVVEAHACLEELRGLLADPSRGASQASLQEGYRLLHCVRGAASMLELGELAGTAEQGEKLLEEAANGERPFDDGAREELAVTVRRLDESLEALNASLPMPPEAPADPIPMAPQTPSRSWPGSAAMDLPEDLLAGFFAEAGEHLTAVGSALRELARDPSAAAPLGEIRRRVHSLKGTASIVGFPDIARLSHALEDTLDRSPLREDRLALLHEAVDVLEDLVRRPGDSGPALLVDPLVRRLRTGAPVAPAAEAPEIAGAPALSPASWQETAGEQVRVPLDRIEGLVRLSSELLMQRTVFERSHEELTRQAGELAYALRRLRGLTDRLEADYEAAALLRGSAGGTAPGINAEFDELEMDRYTSFHLLTRGLAEGFADLEAVGSELADTSSEFNGYLVRQKRLVRDLQDGLLRLRAVPLASFSGRLDRVARSTAAGTGRQAGLTFEAESVELDKGLLEAVADPLLHLVRNAVGHGIEPPAERRTAGKPERGTVRVTGRYQGGQAVIEVSDDGRGIDLAAVRQAAVARGLVAAAGAEALTVEDACQLIFLPGFSTAAAIDEVAGRGVGLDVVRGAVTALRGSVTLASEPGRGARFTLRLPLSLAVTRALLVKTVGRTFALPAPAVVRAGRVDREQIRDVGGEPFLSQDGEDFPVRHLGEILGLRPPGEPLPAQPLAILLDLGDHRAALLVDELTESREVVVKPLGPLLRWVDGLAGATVLGDGSVVPILDPFTLPERASRQAAPPLLDDADLPLEVLIVDDSLSVRRVLSSLARNAGWQPLTARDGLEALEILLRSPLPPDIVLLDVEMPRMDGFELLGTLRGLPAFARLPVVMITSRAGLKHREKGLTLGATDYLVKPYDPEVLVRLVEKLAAAWRRSAA